MPSPFPSLPRLLTVVFVLGLGGLGGFAPAGLFGLFGLAGPPVYAAAAIIPRAPELAATSYILMDAVTGRIIVEENADEPLPPASLTKIMTTYIAMEEVLYGNLQLTDTVRVSRRAAAMGGSTMYLEARTDVSMADLLRGVIVQSGNDASVALAEYIAGSEDAFADMMNQYAELLGMHQSHFMNASGLDSEDNYNTMSARDLALLARAAINRHADLYPMYAERDFTYGLSPDGQPITQPNRNTLLFRDRSVDGLKTGWTDAAGFCLVASARRGDMRLISVVMGAAGEEARASETQKLLTYGFRFFETHRMYAQGRAITTVPVWSGAQSEVAVSVEEDAHITIPRGHRDSLRAVMELRTPIYAPLAAGEVLGTVAVSMEDEQLYSAEVVALQAVELGGLFKRFNDWVTLMFTGDGGGGGSNEVDGGDEP